MWLVISQECMMRKLRIKRTAVKLASYVAVFLSLAFLCHQSYMLHTIKSFNIETVNFNFCNDCRYQEEMSFLTVPKNIPSTDSTLDYRTNKKPSVIIAVCSKTSNEQRRNMIRRTWGSQTEQTKHNFRLIFLLGVDQVSSDEALKREREKHGDIVQTSVIESYANLTRKTLHAFKWVIDTFSGIDYFFKVDDDIFLNISNLLLAINTYNMTDTVAGHCNFYGRPFRDTSHKWYISYKQYPYQFYPPFCSGSGYIMAMETAKKLFNVMLSTPYIHLEDIFVAFAVHRLKLSTKSLPGFHSAKSTFKKINCDCTVLRHYVNSDEIHAFWTGRNCWNVAREQYPCKEFDFQEISDRILFLSSVIVIVLFIYSNSSFINGYKFRLNLR